MLSDAIVEHVENAAIPDWEAMEEAMDHYFMNDFGYTMDVQVLVRAWVEVRNAAVLIQIRQALDGPEFDASTFDMPQVTMFQQ